MTAPFVRGERVSAVVDGRRVWGTVRLVIAQRLLIIQLPDGRRIRRRAL